MEPIKFDPTSHTLTDDLKTQLKMLVPEAFTENAIDFERLKTVLGEMVDVGQERYSFIWPGKTQAIRAAQTPSIGTLVPDKGASEDWDTTQNLYLEGDNLEILKLLQKSYTGKVKMIYIDPPYNTGKDFVYPDNYGEGLKTYLEYTGQVDGEGKKITTNTETDGRYHSKWLNMMYPRLMLARNLLKDDGVIFISIDDHEQANLKKICDEVFGAENFVEQLGWQKVYSTKNQARFVSNDYEYVLMYTRNLEKFEIGLLPRTEEMDKRYINPDNDPRGRWKPGDLVAAEERRGGHYIVESPTGKTYDVPQGKHWAFSESRMREMLQDNRVYFGVDGNAFPSFKQFLTEVKQGRVPSSLLKYEEYGHTDEAKKELVRLFGEAGKVIFETVKPTRLIRGLMYIANVQTEDIIIDFFSGSGTTAEAIMRQNAEDGKNRHFVLTQLQERLEDDSEAKKAGFGNLADIGRERIKLAGAKIKIDYAEKLTKRETPIDTGFRTYRLTTSTFNTWDTTSADDIQAKLLNATSLIKADASTDDVLAELILKSGFGLSEVVTVTEVNGVKVYSVTGGELMIVLEGAVSEIAVRAIADMSPKRFIAQEDAFPDDASLTNAAQIMKDKGIDFRVL